MHLASLTAKVSSFLAIIALVFVFSGVEGKGQNIDGCPDVGYSKTTFTFLDPRPGYIGCSWDIEICYKCDEYGMQVWIKNWGANLPADCPLDVYILNAVDEHILKIKGSTLCTLPPCPVTSSYNFEISNPKCIKFVNFANPSGTGGTTYSVGAIPCNNMVCKRKYKICYDYSTVPPTPISTFVSSSVGTVPFLPIGIGPNCTSTTYPLVPPVNKTWNEAWETECFTLDCGN